MKKMTKKLLPLLLMGIMLVSCNENSKAAPACTVVLTPTHAYTDEVATKVIDNLSKTPFAIKGSYYEKLIEFENNLEYEMSSYNFESALTEDYYYYRYTNKYTDFPVEKRIDKTANGLAKTTTLDPITNETVDYIYGDEKGDFPFASIFFNPFEKSQNCFGLADGKLYLLYPNSFNLIALSNLLTGGVGLTECETLDYLIIEFDGTTPTKLEVCLSNRKSMEYGRYIIKVYKGTFTTVEKVKPTAVPTPRPYQAGQEKLQTMFDKIREGNFTLSVTRKNSKQTKSGKAYFTKDAYYAPYGFGEFGQEKGGMYMTDEGLVEYVVNSNGSRQTKLPYPSRTMATKIGFAYGYSSRCFDVNKDGSFTLVNEPGFYSNVWIDLLPDFYVTPVGGIDYGTLKMKVNESDNTLSYTYTCYEGEVKYNVTISDIGKTILPIDTSTIEKYVPLKNWTEFVESDVWNEDFGVALDLVTGGHKDDIPYIDTQYNYQRGFRGDYDFDRETYQMNLRAVKTVELVYECDTTYEMIQWSQYFREQLAASSKYTFDAVNDVYIYETATAKFSFSMKLSNGFMSMDGLFNRAIIVTMENLLYGK